MRKNLNRTIKVRISADDDERAEHEMRAPKYLSCHNFVSNTNQDFELTFPIERKCVHACVCVIGGGYHLVGIV